MMNYAKKKAFISIFLVSTVLTFFFLLIEINYFIVAQKSYLQAATFVSKKLALPFMFYSQLLFFIFAELVTHVIFIVGVMGLSIQTIYCLRIREKHVVYTTAIVWCACLVGMIALHQYFFPHSKFSQFTEIFLPSCVCWWIALALGICFAGLFMINVVRGIARWPRVAALVFITLCGGIFLKNNFFAVKLTHAPLSQPNIIVVGIDSLRPDFIEQFGRGTDMPFLQDTLNQSVVFSDALTPVARTYPAWISILSGTYPMATGIRTNLLPLPSAVKPWLLSSQLKKAGYFTIYASDETRFSNIDKQFGFDLTVTPPIGISDFVLGTLNDFPISNLLMNTTWGRWLFPNSYANRPVYFTYEPDEFIHFLDARWAAVPNHQPIFLAVHFCLPHFPYVWRDIKNDTADAINYQASLNRVDRQLQLFFSWLTKKGRLDNTIVVLLSDHGEALELYGDRATDLELYQHAQPLPTSLYGNDKDFDWEKTAGHGTDVLGLTQYHTLLAFRFYGFSPFFIKPKTVTVPVSLVDIKPTLLDFLQLSNTTSSTPLYNGQSLKSYLLQPPVSSSQDRAIFIESDFSPQSIQMVHPDTVAVAMGGAHLFKIIPDTGRLEFKQEFLADVYAGKQFAIIKGEWMLALYPTRHQHYVAIILNLKTGKWDIGLYSTFAQKAHAMALVQELTEFYKLQRLF